MYIIKRKYSFINLAFQKQFESRSECDRTYVNPRQILPQLRYLLNQCNMFLLLFVGKIPNNNLTLKLKL